MLNIIFIDFRKIKIVTVTLFLLANALFAETKRIAIVRDDHFSITIEGKLGIS